MAIKISLESVKIPVEIGDLNFEIDVTDEKYNGFIEYFNLFLDNMEKLDDEKSENLELIKEMIKEVYDELLGEGAFDQVYALMPNTAFVSKILVSLVEQLIEEMEKRSL